MASVVGCGGRTKGSGGGVSMFDEIFAEAVGVAIAIKGTALTYTASSAGALSLTGIVKPVRGQQEEDGEHANMLAPITREITISKDPAGEFGGVAAPRIDAKFTIGTDDWAIQSIVSESESLTTLLCVQNLPREISKRGYRG